MNNKLTPQEIFIKAKLGKRLSSDEKYTLIKTYGGYVPNVEKQKLKKGGLAKSQQSLKNWTNQEWMTSGTHANKKRGSNKEVKSKGKKRYLPKAAWDNLSSGEKAATNKAKASSNKQFVKQPKSIAKKAARYRKAQTGYKVTPSGVNQFDALDMMEPVEVTAPKKIKNNQNNQTYQDEQGITYKISFGKPWSKKPRPLLDSEKFDYYNVMQRYKKPEPLPPGTLNARVRHQIQSDRFNKLSRSPFATDKNLSEFEDEYFKSQMPIGPPEDPMTRSRRAMQIGNPKHIVDTYRLNPVNKLGVDLFMESLSPREKQEFHSQYDYLDPETGRYSATAPISDRARIAKEKAEYQASSPKEKNKRDEIMYYYNKRKQETGIEGFDGLQDYINNQRKMAKAQRGKQHTSFNQLINKYQTQGWNSLTDNEKSIYRSGYSHLVKPTGNNNYDAVEMIEPALVIGDRSSTLNQNTPSGSYNFSKENDPQKDLETSRKFLTDWYNSPIALKMKTDAFRKSHVPKSPYTKISKYPGQSRYLDIELNYDLAPIRAKNYLRKNIQNINSVKGVRRFSQKERPNANAYMARSPQDRASSNYISTELGEKLANRIDKLNSNESILERVGKNIPQIQQAALARKNKNLAEYAKSLLPNKSNYYSITRSPGIERGSHDNESILDKYYNKHPFAENDYEFLSFKANKTAPFNVRGKSSDPYIYLKEGNYRPTSVYHELAHFATDGNQGLLPYEMEVISSEIPTDEFSKDMFNYKGNNPSSNINRIYQSTPVANNKYARYFNLPPELIEKYIPENERSNYLRAKRKGPDRIVDTYFTGLPYNYYDNPTEVKVRVDVGRQIAEKYKLWDVFNKIPTFEEFLKLKELKHTDPNLQDLFDNYSDRHLYKIFTTVAQADDKNKYKNYGQKGLQLAQTGTEFDTLAKKYKKKGWGSLTPDEKTKYRSYYSNLVRPTGNNTFDAVEIMQPTEVKGKRLPYGSGLLPAMQRDVVNPVMKGLGYVGETLSTPFAPIKSAVKNYGPAGGIPAVMAINAMQNYDEILPSYITGKQQVQTSDALMTPEQKKNNPYLAGGIDLATGFLEPSLGLGAVAKTAGKVARAPMKAVMNPKNFRKDYGDILDTPWNPTELSVNARQGIMSHQKYKTNVSQNIRNKLKERAEGIERLDKAKKVTDEAIGEHLDLIHDPRYLEKAKALDRYNKRQLSKEKDENDIILTYRKKMNQLVDSPTNNPKTINSNYKPKSSSPSDLEKEGFLRGDAFLKTGLSGIQREINPSSVPFIEKTPGPMEQQVLWSRNQLGVPTESGKPYNIFINKNKEYFNDRPQVGGYYSPSKKLIDLNPEYADLPDFKNAVKHEIRHAEQYGPTEKLNEYAYKKPLKEFVDYSKKGKNKNVDYRLEDDEIDTWFNKDFRQDLINKGILKDEFDQLSKKDFINKVLWDDDIYSKYFTPSGSNIIKNTDKFLDWFNRSLPVITGAASLGTLGTLGALKANQQYRNGGKVNKHIPTIQSEGEYVDSPDGKVWRPNWKKMTAQAKALNAHIVKTHDGGTIYFTKDWKVKYVDDASTY